MGPRLSGQHSIKKKEDKKFHCETIWKIPVRMSESRAGKSLTALLGTRTAPCDAILEDFVACKHSSYLQPQKQMQTTYEINCLSKFLLLILSNLQILSAHE